MIFLAVFGFALAASGAVSGFTLFAACTGLFAVWVVRLIVVPHSTCFWCRGSGRNPFSGAKRFGDCWFCKGSRKRFVLGAKTANQIMLAWRKRG